MTAKQATIQQLLLSNGQIDGCLKKMEAWSGKMKARREVIETCLEKRKWQILKEKRQQQEVPNEDNYQSSEGLAWGPASGHKAPQTAEETDPGRWWVPAEVGCCLRTTDSPCHSCIAQGMYL
jgi:hypothetical protein